MDRRPHESKSSLPPSKNEAERATEQEQRGTDTTREDRHDDDGATTTATASFSCAATPDLEAGKEAQEGSGGGDTDATPQDNKDQLATFKLQRMENAAEAAAGEPSSPGSSAVHEGHQDDGDVEAVSPVARRTSRPGAVAVPGPFLPTRLAGDDDDDEESPSPPVRPPRIGRLERDGSATTASAASLLLSEPVAAAYAVQDSDSDTDDDETHSSSNLHHHHNHSSRSLRREKLEKIRSEILAAAAEAVMVTPPPEQSVGGDSGARKLSARRLKRRRRTVVISIVGAAIVVAAVVAVALGVAVSKLPHGRDPPPAPTSAPGSDVVASLVYREAPEGAFAENFHAEARGGSLFNVAAMASSGTMELINCVVKPCAAGNGTLCESGRVYVPGCCLGSNCPNETKCGDVCPNPPDSCYLTHPDDVTCTHAECYTCHSDLYELRNFAINVDCLDAGTSVRKSNGQTYKWAIACGPVEEGGRDDRNQADGEYQCAAARVGAGYPGGTEGALTDPVSCHYLALAECGCGPPDMNPLDLPPPTASCPVNGTACPFRCDPGSTDARLCRAFPDNVTWWEGTNSLDRNWFSTGVVNAPSDSSLRIYLKDGSP